MMKLKAVFFDLDGTLLPMTDQDIFIKCYFSELAKALAPHGYEPKSFIGGIWKGVEAILHNDGVRRNEAVFWDGFAAVLGDRAREDEPYFADFYDKKFDDVRVTCGYNPKAAETVAAVRSMGLRTVLATNPVFPEIATRKRMGWAGLRPQDFEHYTTYENSGFCKPNPDYYRELLDVTGLSAEEVLMVGNDVDDDMIARTLGMRVFLLTDCLINRSGVDISEFPNGGFDELLAYVRKQMEEPSDGE